MFLPQEPERHLTFPESLRGISPGTSGRSGTSLGIATEEDRQTVRKLVDKVKRGSLLIRTDKTEQASQLGRAIVQFRQSVSGIEDYRTRLDGLSKLLDSFVEGKTQAMKRLRWRVRYLSVCIDIIKRRCGAAETAEDYDKAEYQQQQEACIMMVNRIVAGLVPRFGAYALMVYSALEGERYVEVTKRWSHTAKLQSMQLPVGSLSEA